MIPKNKVSLVLMIRHCVIFFLVLFSKLLLAQNVDSMRTIIASKPHDTVVVSSYLLIGQMLFAPHPDSASYYWNIAKELCEKALTKNPDKTVLRKLMTQKAEALNNVGLYKNNVGNVEGAVKDYFSALKIYEQLDDKIGVLSLFSNIGIIYYGQKDYKKAEESYLKSIRMAETINDSIGLSSAYNYLGYVYAAQLNEEKALKAFLKALSYADQKEVMRLAFIYNDIGIMHYRKKEYDKALENYKYSLELREKSNDKNGIANSNNNIGSVYVALKNYVYAEPYALKALSGARELGYPSLIQNAALELCNIYRATGRPAKALEMYELHILMRDSLFNQETRKASIKSDLKYEFEKKEIELKAAAKAEKEKVELKAAEDKKRQNIITYSVLFGFIVVLVFSFFIYRSLQENKKKNVIIAKQKDLVEEKQKEVMDSINYAKRIQMASLPSEKYIERSLKELNKK